MKILWANLNLLHPTTKGGQIRTLEMLRVLNRRHEIHYAAFADPGQPEGVQRAHEYCAHLHTVTRRHALKSSPAFAGEVARGLFSAVPVAVSRFYDPRMARLIEDLRRRNFDSVVCDFLAAASHFPSLEGCVLFQHNVETAIWKRRAGHASDPVRRLYFTMQAERMQRYEARMCRAASQVVAVSRADAELMRRMFAVTRVSEIPTGVNLEFFAPPEASERRADLVFLGSMDWLPNIHGVRKFVDETLPMIRRRMPPCTLAIVGRTPPREILSLGERDPRIIVTGTVPDVRPWLWGSAVSIVPLYIGGGTRLKIYESMAARIPVVSTTIGAEGLEIHPPRDIRIADSPGDFADRCAELLESPAERARVADSAWEMVASRFSWERVAACFEAITGG